MTALLPANVQELVGLVASPTGSGARRELLAGETPDKAILRAAAMAREGDAQALPTLLAVVWQQSGIEDDARLYQAEALWLLYQSGLWRPYADTVDMGGGLQVPSWKSFVTKYLPMRYATSVARVNVIQTFGVSLGWKHEDMRTIGLSKLQIARGLVQDEITVVEQDGSVRTDPSALSPQTMQAVRESTAQELVQYVAERRNKGGALAAGRFGYNPDSGLLLLWVDDLCYPLGRLNTEPPDGVDAAWWRDVIARAVGLLKAKEKKA